MIIYQYSFNIPTFWEARKASGHLSYYRNLHHTRIPHSLSDRFPINYKPQLGFTFLYTVAQTRRCWAGPWTTPCNHRSASGVIWRYDLYCSGGRTLARVAYRRSSLPRVQIFRRSVPNSVLSVDSGRGLTKASLRKCTTMILEIRRTEESHRFGLSSAVRETDLHARKIVSFEESLPSRQEGAFRKCRWSCARTLWDSPWFCWKFR